MRLRSYLKNTMYDFNIPKPLNLGSAEIEKIAKEFKKKVDFLYGDRIEPMLQKLGCHIYDGAVDDNKISMTVYAKNDWYIFMPWSYKLSTNNRTLIHCLGHYVLHSDMGSKKTMFINWDNDNLKIEHEANIFWKAFLNFENIPNDNNFYIKD